jgi:hypothetical protein
MFRVERLACRFREELGIRGFPGLRGAEDLLRHLAAQLRVIVIEDDDAMCLHWPDGSGATIWVPRRPWPVLHETGHACLTVGLDAYLIPALAKREAWRADFLANQFARAFLLPAAAMADGSEWELAELSGCPIPEVRRRLRQLRS